MKALKVLPTLQSRQALSPNIVNVDLHRCRNWLPLETRRNLCRAPPTAASAESPVVMEQPSYLNHLNIQPRSQQQQQQQQHLQHIKILSYPNIHRTAIISSFFPSFIN